MTSRDHTPTLLFRPVKSRGGLIFSDKGKTAENQAFHPLQQNLPYPRNRAHCTATSVFASRHGSASSSSQVNSTISIRSFSLAKPPPGAV